MNIIEGPTELQRRFELQREAYAGEPYPPWPVRADRLRRLQRLLVRHEAEFAQAIDADFGGRPAIETELAEIWPSLEEVKVALRHGRRWMRPRRVPVSKWFIGARAQLVPQPLGVVGVIVPWNYPVFLAVAPMAAALAAGNRVMVKLSEYTPTFAQRFAERCAEAFATDELTVLVGGADVAAQFTALPLDHLLFTGSTAVGRKVMTAAAANLTPVTLELGGKSPAVLAPDYPLEHAVQRILVGKLLNAGQTCIAPDYLLLPREALPAFVRIARETAQRLYPGGIDDANYCSVVDARQYRRLVAGLDDALARGARAEPLFADGARDEGRHRLAPVMLLDAPADNALMTDEIFGPVLPLVAYDDVEQALAFINARPRPLAMYWFDRDRARTRAALQRTHAGGVTVNDTLLHVVQDALPFGGIGPSGMGDYHGRWGFETFSKLKPVVWQSRWNAMGLFVPPYRPLVRRMLMWMKRL
jgi:coniferyl-aldehyde dehydrogenase